MVPRSFSSIWGNTASESSPLTYVDDPGDVRGVVPTCTNSLLALFAIEPNEAGLMAFLTTRQEVIQISLDLADRGRTRFAHFKAADHLPGAEHLGGQLMKATIVAVVDKERGTDDAGSVGALHHRHAHLGNPWIVTNIV